VRGVVVASWLVTAGCGRWGFRDEGSASDGRGSDVAAGDDAPGDVTGDGMIDGAPDAPAPLRVTCANPNVRSTMTGNAQTPTLVSTDAGYAIAWAESSAPSARFLRLDTSGAAIGTDLVVSSTAAKLVRPGLAWNGNGYAIAWAEGQNPSVRFALLSTTGVQQGQALRISPQATNSLSSLELVYASSQYGFVYVEDGALSFGRVDTAGAALGTDMAVTSQLLGDPGHALFWDGANFGIVYTVHDAGGCPGFNWNVYFEHIDAMGASLGAHQVDAWSQFGFSVCGEHVAVFGGGGAAGNGVGYTRYDGQGGSGRFGALDGAGVVQTTMPVGSNATSPAVATSGSDFGVVWVDGAVNPAELVFVRHDLAGTPMTPEYRMATGSLSTPTIVWNGSNYAIAWQDGRDATGGEIYFALACQ
jgi:hypothetical protein